MTVLDEIKALEGAMVIIVNARRQVIENNRAAWDFLHRVTKRIEARQELAFAQMFGSDQDCTVDCDCEFNCTCGASEKLAEERAVFHGR